MAADDNLLSLVMIVKNEAPTIAPCLERIRPLVDEMVVLDTGSGDDTAERAAGSGARVHHHRWKDDFSEARNASIELARGKWLIFLDADEAVAARDFPRIRELIREDRCDALSLLQRNYLTEEGREANWRPYDGSYEEGEGFAGWIEYHQIRVWRNDPRYRFEGVIHETLDRSLARNGGRVLSTDIALHHFGLATGDRAGRSDFYLRLGLKEIARGPENFKPYYEVGLIYLGRRELEPALKYLEEAARLGPNSPQILSDLSYALLQSGRHEEAARRASRALELNPGLESAHLNLGVIYFQTGDPQKASDHFRRAVELNPSRARTHHNLGAALARQNRNEPAVEHLERALAIKPDDLESALLLADVLKRAGRPREALERLRRAGETNRDDPKILFRTGMLQEELGLFREAVGSYRHLMRLHPETAGAVRERLTEMERRLGEGGD